MPIKTSRLQIRLYLISRHIISILHFTIFSLIKIKVSYKRIVIYQHLSPLFIAWMFTRRNLFIFEITFNKLLYVMKKRLARLNFMMAIKLFEEVSMEMCASMATLESVGKQPVEIFRM